MASPSSVLAVLRAARPALPSRAAALALAVHAALSAEGCVLVACGEAARREGEAKEASLEGWDGEEDEYAFRYTDEAGSASVLLTALAAGGKLHLDLSLAPPAPVTHLELSVDDFTTERLSDGYGAAFSNLDALVGRLRPLLAAVCPSAQPTAATSGDQSGRAPQASRVEPPPLRGGGGQESRSGNGDLPPGQFRGIGDRDLYPVGLPSLPALGPFGPSGGRGGNGGGSLVGPHHPAFFPGGQPPSHPLRPGDLPPGARFDPYGPAIPGFEPGRFGGERRDAPPQRPPVHPDIAQLGGDDDAYL